jgi:hypothetical protein
MKALRALIIMLALSVCASAGGMPCDRIRDMENDKAGDEAPRLVEGLDILLYACL